MLVGAIGVEVGWALRRGCIVAVGIGEGTETVKVVDVDNRA